MKSLSIADSLTYVDPALIVFYENKHLGGVSLHKLHEEYLTVRGSPEITLIRILKLLAFGLICFLVWALCGIVSGMSRYLVFIPPFAFIGLIHLYMRFPLKKRFDIVNRCKPALEEFRDAVRALNPFEDFVVAYNAASIRKILVGLASKVLKAEWEFDEMRFLDVRHTPEIVALGTSLLKYQNTFKEASRLAQETFGLDFSNSELFTEARNLCKLSKR